MYFGKNPTTAKIGYETQIFCVFGFGCKCMTERKNLEMDRRQNGEPNSYNFDSLFLVSPNDIEL